MKNTIRINSEKLWSFINELATNEKVEFKVYYDGNYVTEIFWNGENFEWESGTFTSQAFFNPMYDFEPLGKEEFEDITDFEEIQLECQKIISNYDGEMHYINTNIKDREVYIKLINQLIKNQKKIIERLNKME